MPVLDPIRIVLVDDHDHMRRLGAIWVLEDDRFELAGVTHDGHDAIVLAERVGAHAVLLDLHLPTVPGLVTLRVLKERRPDVAVAVLTGDADLLDRAVELGADLVYLKGDPLIDVFEDIVELVHGRRAEVPAPGS